MKRHSGGVRLRVRVRSGVVMTVVRRVVRMVRAMLRGFLFSGVVFLDGVFLFSVTSDMRNFLFSGREATWLCFVVKRTNNRLQRGRRRIESARAYTDGENRYGERNFQDGVQHLGDSESALLYA